MCVSESGVGVYVCWWGQRLSAIWQTEESPPQTPPSHGGIQDGLPLAPQPCQGKGAGGWAEKGQRQVGLESALHSVLIGAQLDRLGDQGILGEKPKPRPYPIWGAPVSEW